VIVNSFLVTEFGEIFQKSRGSNNINMNTVYDTVSSNKNERTSLALYNLNKVFDTIDLLDE